MDGEQNNGRPAVHLRDWEGPAAGHASLPQGTGSLSLPVGARFTVFVDSLQEVHCCGRH